MASDVELLSRYADQRDESAFAELVHRHLNHVYSTALRLVGRDTQLAEDVTQTVFTALAREADSLRRRTMLSGWLHTTARFAAAKVVRSEQRRRQREGSALIMNVISAAPEPDWEQVRCLLDEAIGELSSADRDAILLRYFEQRAYAQIGAVIGLAENAARMRVERALDKLRARLALKGITSTVATLAGALTQNAVTAAPAALEAEVVGTALGVSAAAGVATPWWLTTAGKVAMVLTAIAMGGASGALSAPKRANRTISEAASGAPKVIEPPKAAAQISRPNATAPITPFARLYSSNAKEFMARLRAAHCPEETVKDIIVAEIRRRFASQEDALKPKPSDHVPWGWSARTSESKLMERRQLATAVVREEAALIESALGYAVPVSAPLYAVRTSDQRFEEALNGLPAAKQIAASQIHEQYWLSAEDLQRRTKGFWQSEDVAELDRLKVERRNALENIMK